ncbi:P-loop containing nucleoside triphosphate hydrolase protein [Syncephalis fuscata]|nr:P-loop containing nucleoside triphosphate hydrolase protein [Syncephalis fuscata]
MARKTQRRKRPMTKEEIELDGSDVSEGTAVEQVQPRRRDTPAIESDSDDSFSDLKDISGNNSNDGMSFSDIDMSDAMHSVDEDSDTDMDVSNALIPVPANGRKSKKDEKRNSNNIDDGFDNSNNDDDDDDDDADFINQQIMSNNKKKKKSGGFQSMGLSKPVFNAVLKKGYKVPTPIQRKCIPLVMDGNDVVGMARTGSGKTAAFLIPMLEKLKGHSAKVGARAIVLSPSRELAMQTQKAAKDLARFTDLRSCVIVGGDSLEDQFRSIASNPDILIATPGRLLHLIVEMELELKTVEYIVFDEADRLFEMGFSVQLHEILHRLPSSRQTLLFSATLPKILVDFAKAGLQDPTLVRLDADTKISADLEMAFFALKQEEKDGALLYLLRDVIKVPKITNTALEGQKTKKKNVKRKRKNKNGDDGGDDDDDDDEIYMPSGRGKADKQTIIFVATKHHVEYVANLLTKAGYALSYIYGSLDQVARRQHIEQFRRGFTSLLVVTDVAARGIDIPILENVINYDFVDGSKVFVHRVGRAARAGRRGWAYSLIAPDELPFLVDLHLFLARPLKLGKSATSAPDYSGEIVLGTLPRTLLEDDVEWTRRQLRDNTEINDMYGVMQNAYRMFYKSRSRAAAESYKRAKELISDAAYSETHRLLADKVGGQLENERADLVAAIASFRPAETIFEIGSRGTRKASEAALIVRQRRTVVDAKIEAIKAKKAAAESIAEFAEEANTASAKLPAGSSEQADETMLRETFKIASTASTKANKKKSRTARDEEFYMSHYQKDANTERGYSMTQSGSFMEQARGAVLDFTGEDTDEMKNKRGKLRWDAKKKKFVQGTGVGSDNKKMVRTESGALISATYKSGRYTDWQEKTKINIPRAGEQELSTGKINRKRYRHNKTDAPKEVDRFHVAYERKQKKFKKQAENEKAGETSGASNSGGGHGGGNRANKSKPVVKSELKNADQIRKAREVKERRRAKTGRHSKPAKGKRR